MLKIAKVLITFTQKSLDLNIYFPKISNKKKINELKGKTFTLFHSLLFFREVFITFMRYMYHNSTSSLSFIV
jgi:hypothetical protein